MHAALHAALLQYIYYNYYYYSTILIYIVIIIDMYNIIIDIIIDCYSTPELGSIMHALACLSSCTPQTFFCIGCCISGSKDSSSPDQTGIA